MRAEALYGILVSLCSSELLCLYNSLQINPMTPAGNEPATLRSVAQHLNHCATAVPTVKVW